MAKLIFGCGYLGLRVARRWLAEGEDVYVMTRSSARSAGLAEIGLKPFVGDITNTFRMPGIERLDTVLYAVGFDRSSGRSIREIYVQGLQGVLDTLGSPVGGSPVGGSPVGKFIYISSTGVYGQTDGAWVDEQSPCRPQREGGRACLEAEERLRAHRWGQRAVILRLAGIYGPGRIPRLQTLLAGDALASTPDGYLNLIHVDDAAQVVLAAESRAEVPTCYVVSDGQPVSRREFYAQLARLTGSPEPRFAKPAAGSSAAERGSTHKRVSNRRMLEQLNVSLQYQSYIEGLADIVSES